ncbi:MAG TPA: hypothetical protein VFD70_16285 [Anaerolineae bacterium]|nr:hypothetical protein [Anaerolineae bacterium]
MADVRWLRDVVLAELFQQFPKTVLVFVKHHMACVGCDLNGLETVADAIAHYELAENEFLEELGSVILTPNLPPLQSSDKGLEEYQ